SAAGSGPRARPEHRDRLRGSVQPGANRHHLPQLHATPAKVGTRYPFGTTSKIWSNPEYSRMSCRWRLTPARRSLPPEASSRFWVFRSTPSPALEMYSSLLQSTVTVPLTPSRNDWALGDCAASRRPAITTVASAPYSIANIAPLGASRIGRIHACYSRLPEGSPALTGLLGVMVLDGIDQSADEVQAQAPGGALLDRKVDFRVRRL